MFRPHTRTKALIGSTKGKVFLSLIFLTLVALVGFQLANTLGAAHAGQGTRQLIDTLGDKDDLPVAPTAPISCTRAGTGKGVVQGTITDANTGKPVANAYIGISPGTVNSFACYTHSNADGSFDFNKLDPGTYNLSASRWTVMGTEPLYRDSEVYQIPVGSGKVTVNVALTPLQSPGYRKIGSNDATNLIIVDMDETYFNSWFTDYNSVASPKVTPAIHGFAKQAVNAIEEWTQYGYSPIDHYQLATGGFPVWRTPDGPAKYWTQPDPNLDVNLWYSGGPKTAEEFGQESIFDVAKSYGMNTAVIGGNDYPSGHITDANIDEINLAGTNPCSTPSGEIKKMENFITSSLNNPNGFLLYAPLTQAEGFNTENTSPDAPPQVFSCSSENGWDYAQASIWDDQAFGQLLDFLKKTKQGPSTLYQNTAIIVTGDEAENDITNFDNFYPTGPGEPGLGTTRHTPWLIEGPNIYQDKVYKAQMRIDDTSVNAMAALGLPAPYDSRGHLIPQFFIHQPQVLQPPVQGRQSVAFVPGNGGAGGFDAQFLSAQERDLFLAGKLSPNLLQSQGFISLLENNVGGYTTTISAQNESTSPIQSGTITVYDQHGNVVVTKKLNAPLMPNSAWVINAAKLGLPAGFAGTALLQADQPLAVVSNETSPNGPTQSMEGYSALETGSSLYAPLVLNAVNGVTSYLSISNLSPCQQCGTTVTVTFYNAKGQPLAHTSSQLKPFGQMRVDAGKVGLPKGATVDAIITSNPPQALAATIYTLSGQARSFTYNALSNGDLSLNDPLVENAVSGQSTSLTLENSATMTDHVTITYRDTSGKTVATQNVTVVARGSATETAAGAGLPSGFTGSAVITSDHRVAVISQVSHGKYVSAFNVIRSLDYTLYTSVYEPQVQNAVGGVTSSVTVTNTGTQSTTEQIQYFNYNGESVGNTPTATLAPGASYTFNQGDPSSGLPAGFKGSAVVTSSAFQHSSVVVTYSGNEVRSYDGSQAQTGQLVLTIGQLRQNFSSFNGLVVTVVGAIVTRSFGPNWFIQDSTGGIRVYVGGGAGQQDGDIETVTGVLTTYSGELEIDPSSASDVIKTGTGKIPAPVVVTTQQIAQLKYNSPIDGELVTIPVSTITSYNPPSLGLTDSSGVQCNAYFDSYAQKNIDLSKFHQGEQVVTTGVLQLFGNNYKTSVGEIDPLLKSDFVMYG
ncbi:MAG TPA: carboxypeptidase regulatory-like domain-containing protein [Ktedonobacteraceae bacterium]|nr:carboxypeptidase regulatory-like domain-containing protein [Ktedonobacteraceae bacterium]